MKNAIGIIHKHYTSFSAVERKIADFILANAQTLIYMTTAALAKELGISQGSIIKFANSLGFNGYSELKLNIAQNLPNHEKVLSSKVTEQDTAHEVLCKLANEVTQTFAMTAAAVQNSELIEAADVLQKKKRIEFYGVGSSAVIALDAYYRFMRQGLPASAVTDAHIASVSASFLDKDCTAVAISYSGRTVETLKAAQIAKEKGAFLISLTSCADSPLAKLSDLCLVSAAKETDSQKEALSARYSQLLILDALLMYVSFRDVDSAIRHAENISEIIGAHRIYD